MPALGRHPSRPRIPHLAGDIALILGAAIVGLSLAAITPGHSHWPARPPLAELTVTGSTTSQAWQAVPPLQSTWRSDRDEPAPASGRIIRSWARIEHWRTPGKTVLFLQIPQRPNLILLLRYQRLTAAGTPAGNPQRTQCSMASQCTRTRCIRHGEPGECVVMDNLGYRDGTIVVVVAGWARSTVSRADTDHRGSVTEYGSWGFVASPPSAPTSARPHTERGLPRRTHPGRAHRGTRRHGTSRRSGFPAGSDSARPAW